MPEDEKTSESEKRATVASIPESAKVSEKKATSLESDSGSSKKVNGQQETTKVKDIKVKKKVKIDKTPEEKTRLTTDKQSVFNVIEQEMNNLNDIGHHVWNFAEVGGKEHQSCKRIVDFLKQKGFRTNNVCNDFDTAFRVEFGSGEAGGKAHPNIAFMCEYSAVPSKGHSKGHNLVTATCLAAAIGLQRVIGFSKKPLGRVTVIGCPSNNTRTAKKEMMEGGCFNGIDFLIAAYPANYTCLKPKFLASMQLHVTFRGRACGQNPWEGANPVNGIVLTQQSLAAHRQTFAPGWEINGVIPYAGDNPCELPEKAMLVYEMKAATNLGIKVLNEKLHQCLEGASHASGCKYEHSIRGHPMVPNVNCPAFVDIYRKNAKLNGYTFHDDRNDMIMEPDDISFISQFIPTFRLFYYAGTSAAIGTDEFNKFCGSPEAEYMNIVQGKSLAMMATDIFTDNEIMQEIMALHETDVLSMKETSFLEEQRKNNSEDMMH